MVWRILLVATLAPSLVYSAPDAVTSRSSLCLDELDKRYKQSVSDGGRGKRQDPLEYLIPALSPVCQSIVKQAMVEVKQDREANSPHHNHDLKLERSECLEQLDKHYTHAGNVRGKRQDPLEYLIPALTPVCQTMVKQAMVEVQRDRQQMKMAHSTSHLDGGGSRVKRYVKVEIPFLSDSYQGQQPTFSTAPSLGAGNPTLNLPPNSNSFPANVQLNVDRNNVQVRPQTGAPPVQNFPANVQTRPQSGPPPTQTFNNAVTLNPPGDVVFPRPQPVNTFPQTNNFNQPPPSNLGRPPPNNFGRPPPNNFNRPPPNFQGRPSFSGRGDNFGFNNSPQRSFDSDQPFFRH